jgi:hypothetical protein
VSIGIVNVFAAESQYLGENLLRLTTLQRAARRIIVSDG